MRRFLAYAAAASAVFGLTACGPDVFSMLVDMRQPSDSGLDLSGKSMSVVYMEDPAGRDSLFSAAMAEGFAGTLESDYFGGEESMGVYRMSRNPEGVYSSKDTLVSAAMQTGSDVVFLFDTPSFGKLSVTETKAVSEDSVQVTLSAPFKLNLYAYNTLGADTVRVFKGASTLLQTVQCAKDESEDAIEMAFWKSLSDAGSITGTRSASTFLSNWSPETYYFYYFDTPAGWGKASDAAYDYRWRDALDLWMTLLDSKDMYRRGAAEYNIAGAFYLLGDYGLATEWLDRSDSDCKMVTSSQLRRKIEAKRSAVK